MKKEIRDIICELDEAILELKDIRDGLKKMQNSGDDDISKDIQKWMELSVSRTVKDVN